jgi:hypothetical protein
VSVVPLVKAASGLQVNEGTITVIPLATFSDQELSESLWWRRMGQV